MGSTELGAQLVLCPFTDKSACPVRMRKHAAQLHRERTVCITRRVFRV